MTSVGTHHKSIRKRIHKNGEAFPHPDKFKRLYDKLIYVVAIVTPFANLPQLLRIWQEKDASGVSVISWASFSVLSLLWLIYGLLHKDKPIIFVNGLLIFIQSAIAISAYAYA